MSHKEYAWAIINQFYNGTFTIEGNFKIIIVN